MPPPLPRPPGVPPLLKAVTNVSNTIALVASDVALVRSILDRPKWGIYRNGVQVVQADTATSFEFKQEYRVSDYPQAQGSFESYNKVGSPFDARIRLVRGGNLAQRTAFLNAIEQATNSLELYDVVTPEKVYASANIASFDYRRQLQNGVGLITVDIRLVQIRVTTSVKFSSTVQPSGATPINGGNVQAQPATAEQTAPAVAAANAGP